AGGDIVDECVRKIAGVVDVQPIMIVVLGADLFDRVLDRGLLFGEFNSERHGVSVSNLAGVNAAQAGSIASPNTYALMISAVIGAMSQPLRECPAAMNSPSPVGPIIGHPSGDIGRMPAQALSRAVTWPGSSASAAATSSA